MTWRVAAASAIGTSHVKTGQACQDSACVRVIGLPEGEVFVAAVSDGAGSATRSDIGSRVAVTTAVFLIENYLSSGGKVATIERETAVSWLAQIQATIAAFAEEANEPPRQFACTLLVAVIGRAGAAFFQVGDGAMVVKERADEGWSYVFWPQHGEYINSTNFVTSSDATSVMEFASATRDIESFAAFSDGIESLVLHYATKTVHDPFFNAMIAPVRQASTKGLDGELSKSLLDYLNSDRVCNRTDDDKSLVLATRYETATLDSTHAPS